MDSSLNHVIVPADRNLDNVVVSIRLRGSEAVRYWKLMDVAKARNPYAHMSHVIREMLGLDPPNLVTKEELEHFRTAKKSVEATLDGRKITPSSSPAIKHYKGERKKKNKVG